MWMGPIAGRLRSYETRERCVPIRPVPIEHRLALRLRIAISFAAIESLVGFDADQRSAIVPCFAAISISCRKSGTKWSLTLMQLPRYGAFDPVFPGEEHLSCSGRLLSRGVAANVIDYRRGFWRYRYCRKLGRKHGKSVDAGGRFRLPLFRVETLAQACPRCGSPVTRVHRHRFDRVISLIYPVRRYRCRTCPCEGLLRFRTS